MQSTVCQARRVHAASSSPAGFSLVELMITLVVMSVAMAMAVPGFRYLNNSSRITAPANELVAGLQLARAEAVRRNARVVLCGSSDGASCAGGSNWGGWIVFADTDSDNTVDAGEDVLMTYAVQAPATDRTNEQYPLTLNTGRIRDQWHTMTRTGMSPRLGQHLPEPFVEVHPDDAARHGVADQLVARRLRGRAVAGIDD